MKTFKRLVIVAWLALTLLNLNGQVFRWVGRQEPIKRFVIKNTVKGVLSNWNFDWIIK